ncbi:MAG TPA: DUF6364 family protein [Planctomycetota bacterium]|jgi:hypothetical protein
MSRLTLSVDKDVVKLAKRLAAEDKTSVSSMFERFVRFRAQKRKNNIPIAPITRQLTGIISAPKDKTDRQLIEEALLARYDIKP